MLAAGVEWMDIARETRAMTPCLVTPLTGFPQ